MSIGWLLALLALISSLVLFLIGRMDGGTAAMFGALALSILLSPFPIKWPGQSQ